MSANQARKKNQQVDEKAADEKAADEGKAAKESTKESASESSKSSVVTPPNQGQVKSLGAETSLTSFLTMEDDLTGKEVALCRNVKQILPCIVIAEQSPVGREKRLLLEGSFLTRDKVYDEDEDIEEAYAPEREQFVFTEHKQRFNLVRYFDPCILRDQNQVPVLDSDGNTIPIGLSFKNCLQGTWFFIDRYEFQIRLFRSEIKNVNPMTGLPRNSGHRRERSEIFPSATTFYSNWRDCWTEIQRQAQRGRPPGSFWDSDSLEIIIKEKEDKA